MTSAVVNVERFGRSDLIYSVGLCDYIPDKYLIPMLEGWRGSLSPGGTVYVAFKDCKRYTTPEYQWLVDWFFLQRTEEECRHLFAAAGYDMDELEMSRDETGIIINFVGAARCRRSCALMSPPLCRCLSMAACRRTPRNITVRKSQRRPAAQAL